MAGRLMHRQKPGSFVYLFPSLIARTALEPNVLQKPPGLPDAADVPQEKWSKQAIWNHLVCFSFVSQGAEGL